MASGADALVVGAGLPLDLPDLAREHPGRRADPDPVGRARRAAGGAQVGEEGAPARCHRDRASAPGGRPPGRRQGRPTCNDRRFDFDVVLPEVLAFFRHAGIEGRIPLIAAGGIESHDDIRRLQALGASAVQLGTAFAVTARMRRRPGLQAGAGRRPARGPGGVHQRRRPAGARRAHAVARQVPAAAGATAEARRTPRRTAPCGSIAWRSAACATARPSWGQFCIDKVLGHALAGDVRKGLFFRGAGRLPFGEPDPPGAGPDSSGCWAISCRQQLPRRP